MDLDFLQGEWDKDCVMDRSDLVTESLMISQYHSKYYKFLSTARLKYERELEKRKTLKATLNEYYQGKLGKEELALLDREQYPKTFHTKEEMREMIEGDKLMNDSGMRLVYYKEQVEFLQDVIKSIHQRSYNIRNMIEWEKFKNGIG